MRNRPSERSLNTRVFLLRGIPEQHPCSSFPSFPFRQSPLCKHDGCLAGAHVAQYAGWEHPRLRNTPGLTALKGSGAPSYVVAGLQRWPWSNCSWVAHYFSKGDFQGRKWTCPLRTHLPCCSFLAWVCNNLQTDHGDCREPWG